MIKKQNSKQPRFGLQVLDFPSLRFCGFEFISDFVLRVSDFEFTRAAGLFRISSFEFRI